jgi:DNA-binding MarR family transcriptional regulator
MLMQPLPRQEPVGLLIGAARRRIKQAVGRRLRPFRLTPQQFWLLVAIQEGRAPSLTELADRLRGDQPTASRIVAALVRRRLVRVDVDPVDRRRSKLSTAPAGDALRSDLAAVAAEIRAGVVAGMDEAEQEAIRAGLRKVIANMDRLENGSAPARGRARGRRRNA